MKVLFRAKWMLGLFSLMLLIIVGCSDGSPEDVATAQPATPDSPIETPAPAPTRDRDFVVIATDAPLPPFTEFDQFGNVVGLNNSAMEAIASVAEIDYEFVVTPHQGVLELLASGSQTDFDAVMSSLLLPEQPIEGVSFSEPYLEIGQVLVVLADENELLSPADIQPGMRIAVQGGSQAEVTARETLGIAQSNLLNEFEKPEEVIQALLDEAVRVAIMDSQSAEFFAESFPQQIKISGGDGRDAWIDSKSYGIAVAQNNQELLGRLNQAILTLRMDDVVDDIAVQWLVAQDLTSAAIDPGESRVGTPQDEFFIGILGQLEELDPATINFDLINWEIMSNSMSGLYMFDANNELQPVLAQTMPAISEDNLEYTIQLKEGLVFPDGSEFTAEDVRWSVIRASRLGNYLVNGILKDSNEDNFADVDSVQVMDTFTVKFILQEPAAYFPSMLATPPYFPISSDCFAETADPGSICGGIGPYTIASWDQDRLRLEANSDWPGWASPIVENITIRFYNDPAGISRSLLEFESIDLAWTGLPYSEFVALQNASAESGEVDLDVWTGPAAFKSYLIFDHASPTWSNIRTRQGASYALDRSALVENVFQASRIPLLSPVPDQVPGHVPVFPQPDLDRVVALMLEAGYSAENPLQTTIWFVNDGRYSDREEQYVTAIRDQLNATGVFQIDISGAPWEQFRIQIAECGYETYLLGWPSPGRPVDYLDPSSWTDFFIQETDSIFCSNYESAEMGELLQMSREETDPQLRMEIYDQIQTLWADELPTLDLSQEPRRALSLAKVDNVAIDAMGFLHYELLSKE